MTNPISQKMMALAQQIDADLKAFREKIALLRQAGNITDKEYEKHLEYLQNYQAQAQEKIHLLKTMLETDSDEILDYVRPRTRDENTG